MDTKKIKIQLIKKLRTDKIYLNPALSLSYFAVELNTFLVFGFESFSKYA